MTWKTSAWAKEQVTGSPAKKALLLCLADRSDDNGMCYPGQETLARETEQGERTVRRQLKDLERDGLIVRERRYDKHGHRTSDRYWLQIPTGQSGRKAPETQIPTGQTDIPTGHRGSSLPATAMAGELPVEPPAETPQVLEGEPLAAEHVTEDIATTLGVVLSPKDQRKVTIRIQQIPEEEWPKVVDFVTADKPADVHEPVGFITSALSKWKAGQRQRRPKRTKRSSAGGAPAPPEAWGNRSGLGAWPDEDLP